MTAAAGTTRDAGPVVIACASDHRYIQPLAAMLRSTIDNFGEDRELEIHVIQSGITGADRDRITKGWPANTRVNWIDAHESEYAGLPLWGRMPVSTYFKLGLPDLLPSNVEKVVWLDCDVIVLDDITGLWEIPLASAPLAAVQDAIVPLVSSVCGIGKYREIGIPGTAPYFNAGVMVVDVAAWRRESVAARAMDYLKRYQDSVTFWDQEGLNAALAGRWLSLEPRWNHNASIPRRGSFNDELPSIAHFAGGLKPWRYPTRDSLRSLYYVYLDKTAFAGWRPAPSLAGDAVSFYEGSGLRLLLYPAENLGMRIVRGLSRRAASARDSHAAVERVQ